MPLWKTTSLRLFVKIKVLLKENTHMLSKIYTITKNTFKETIRDRILYAMLFFAIVMSFMSVVVGSFSVGNTDKLIIDFGLGSINIFGVILAIFVGTSLVFKEIDRKTIYIILSKPIERWEFIVGKFLGLSFTLTLVMMVIAGFFMTLLFFYDISMTTIYHTFIALLMLLLELYIVTSLAILFSTISSPLLSMLFVLAIWLAGHFSPALMDLAKFSDNMFVLILADASHYTLPDFSKFNFKNSINDINYTVDLVRVGYTSLYGILYAGVILLLAVLGINEREFN